jgi:hypothetical protein
MQIIPAILATTEEEYVQKLKVLKHCLRFGWRLGPD